MYGRNFTSDRRTRTKICSDAIQNISRRLLERGVFKYVNKEKVTRNSNILGGRFLPSMKPSGTETEI